MKTAVKEAPQTKQEAEQAAAIQEANKFNQQQQPTAPDWVDPNADDLSPDAKDEVIKMIAGFLKERIADGGATADQLKTVLYKIEESGATIQERAGEFVLTKKD